MMLAYSIKQILVKYASSLGVKADHIYSYSIDPNVRANDTKDLVILITEISDTPQNYGSNYSINRQGNIQIQIFFPQSYTKDTSELRNKVDRILEDHDWYCTLDTGINRDPDVSLLMNTSHWRKSHK